MTGPRVSPSGKALSPEPCDLDPAGHVVPQRSPLNVRRFLQVPHLGGDPALACARPCRTLPALDGSFRLVGQGARGGAAPKLPRGGAPRGCHPRPVSIEMYYAMKVCLIQICLSLNRAGLRGLHLGGAFVLAILLRYGSGTFGTRAEDTPKYISSISIPEQV